jgi:Zn-dependent protease
MSETSDHGRFDRFDASDAPDRDLPPDPAATPADAPIVAHLAESVDPLDAPPEIQTEQGVILAELAEEMLEFPAHRGARPPMQMRRRRRLLPLILFVVTCISTFFAGACAWVPLPYVSLAMEQGSLMPLRRVMVTHWDDGLLFMLCLIGILLAHEMGHFLATVRYRVPASFPFFLPLPILSPIGTLGAVIAMEGSRADRKQIFDIGIAGPLAGLVVAVPVLWVGVLKLDFTEPQYGLFALDAPLLVTWMLGLLQPAGYTPGQDIVQSHLNPYFMAGWVGLLVTALNMMPISQLDGGHVVYTLLGKRTRWATRGFIVVAVAFMIFINPWFLLVITVLIMLVGIDHPPTRDDRVPLGWFRVALGISSLAIPVLCFAPRVLIPIMPLGSQ